MHVFPNPVTYTAAVGITEVEDIALATMYMSQQGKFYHSH